MSYFLLFEKNSNTLYDTVAYNVDSVKTAELEITERELKKLNENLSVIEKCGNGLDVALSCFEKAQRKLKETCKSDVVGMKKMLDDIGILIDYIDDKTFDIIFINKLDNTKFKIDKLGEIAYKNIFIKYKELTKKIQNYKFEDNFVWRRMTTVSNDDGNRKRQLRKRSDDKSFWHI